MASNSTISMSFKLVDGADGMKTLIASTQDLQKFLSATVTEAEKLNKKFVNFAAIATGLSSIRDAVNQLSATLQNLTGESEGFDKAMKEANTMAGKDSAGFKQLKEEIADLAKEIPIARDQLANGLYQTISNGVPEDNWIEFLNTSARSAVGGLADINKVVGVTSTLIKNYGLEWEAAADIQDKIQLTAKNGVTSFEQLAQALPRVAGNAATLGVSIDELMGTFATLTGVSGNTAEVSTQLAAIFTALVKPSSEAGKMAAEMGIQFDAAAIKAAGGFQNFLHHLDVSVKGYAQTSGVLEEEVYGRLFGSAEAMRALIPLQGELSEKFTVNVANMVNSAGTMEAAYSDMSSTGEAVNQMLHNQWASLMDVVSGFTSAAQPYINFIAGIGNVGSSLAILYPVLKKVHLLQLLTATGSKLAAAGMVVLGQCSKTSAAFVSVFSSTMKGTAYSATALRIALRGLLMATGIGAAIAVATAIIGHFADATDDATESVGKLDDATDDYAQAAAGAKIQIDRDIKALDNLIKAKKDTQDAVRQLNDSYGEFFGTQATAEGWYKTLTEKSELYVKQIGYEAQARALAAKIAENAINKELAAEKKADWEKQNKDKMRRGRKDIVTGTTEMFSTDDEWKSLTKNYDELEGKGIELQKRLDKIKEKAGGISAELTGGLPGPDTKNKPVDKSKKAKGSEGSWKVKESKGLENPKDLKTIEDFNKRISFLEAKRLKAKSEEIPFIDAEIASTKRLRDEFEGASNAAGQIKPMEGANFGDALKDGLEMGDTFAKLDAEISAMEEKMRHASSNEVMALQRVIDKLKEEREALETLREIPGLEAGLPAIRSQLAELQSLDGKELEVKLKSIGGEKLRAELEAVDSHIDAISDQMNLVGMDSDQWSGLYEMREGLRGARDQLKNYIKISDGLSERKAAQQEAIDALTGSFARLGSAIGGAAGEWISYAAGVAEAVSKAIPQIAMLVAQQKAQANANSESAVTGAMASVASIPVVGWIMAGAAATSVIAAMAGIPKFAKGGIAYGPTLGVFGEYAGAANNPEVVAPLDRLRTLLRPAESGVAGGTVRFRIDGRTLAGVLEKEYNIKHRS